MKVTLKDQTVVQTDAIHPYTRDPKYKDCFYMEDATGKMYVVPSADIVEISNDPDPRAFLWDEMDDTPSLEASERMANFLKHATEDDLENMMRHLRSK